MDHVESESRRANTVVARARFRCDGLNLSSLPRLLAVSLLSFHAVTPAYTSAAFSGTPLQTDARLRRTLIVRVSRMPLADLFQRIGAATDVRLLAEGEDVADQKIDLFARELPAHEILTAITHLLNSEGPRGYRWERSGQAPGYRYLLVRDVASRQWEARQSEAADQRLADLLHARLRALSSERGEPGERTVLPAMRKLAAALSADQVTRLVADHLLVLTATNCPPDQRSLLAAVVDALIRAELHNDPERAQQQLARFGPPNQDPGAHVAVELHGEGPLYTIILRVNACRLGQGAQIAQVTLPTSGTAAPAAPAPARVVGGRDPVFALAPGSSWLMGDVLADIAARAKLNLMADDYTRTWAGLAEVPGAQPLSVWLAAIRDRCGFQITQEGGACACATAGGGSTNPTRSLYGS